MSELPRPIIIVLGMHRSGTSLAMSVVHALGVACGKSLIPADRGNVAGFWENSEIVRIHEHLLASLGRVWHGPMGTYPLPEGWLQSGSAREAQTALVALLRKEMNAAAPAVWGFKDPRTARLLPLWRRVLDEIGAVPLFLLAVRHPVAVCSSLAKHNGVDPARGQLLWLQHNLGAIADAGDRLRLIVNYDNLVSRPATEIERISRMLEGIVSAPDRDRAAGLVSEKLRSHDQSGMAIENGLAREAYEHFAKVASDEEDPAALRPIAERYREAEKLFLPWRRDSRSTLGDWAVRALLTRKYGG